MPYPFEAKCPEPEQCYNALISPHNPWANEDAKRNPARQPSPLLVIPPPPHLSAALPSSKALGAAEYWQQLRQGNLPQLTLLYLALPLLLFLFGWVPRSFCNRKMNQPCTKTACSSVADCGM